MNECKRKAQLRIRGDLVNITLYKMCIVHSTLYISPKLWNLTSPTPVNVYIVQSSRPDSVYYNVGIVREGVNAKSSGYL